jgi:hypothetical protein
MSHFTRTSDLQPLLTAIAASPIVVRVSEPRDFADWCEQQQTADIDIDIDTVILGWLRSQRPQASALS